MASCKSYLQVYGEYISFLCIRRDFVKRGKKFSTLMAIIGIYAVVFKLHYPAHSVAYENTDCSPVSKALPVTLLNGYLYHFGKFGNFIDNFD